MRPVHAVLLFLFAGNMAVAGESAKPPAFARKPTAVKAGDKVRIDFAVDRETDVAVFVEDAQGKIVRHLVAGVLGRNSPPPLKANSLDQSIEWDGKADWGKTAGAGPFKVRVALGLAARFDKVLASDPQSIGGVSALAVGPDGTLYCVAGFGASLPNWTGQRIVALDRDGRYLRTVAPFPVNLAQDQIAGFGVYQLDGQPVPLVKNIPTRNLYASAVARKAGLAVTVDGVIIRLVGGYGAACPLCIAATGVKGDVAWGQECGPGLLKLDRPTIARPFICTSSDGRSAYLSGIGCIKPDKKPDRISFAAVYRAKLPDRGPAEPLFGTPEEPGKDDSHLGDQPRGLAVDGKGHLLIADHKNDRVVVVSEAEGKLVGQFAVDKPDALGVDPRTGAVYVTSLLKGGVSLVKFSGWKDAKEQARLPIPAIGNPDFPPMIAVDASADPVVVWVATDGGGLYRVEDKGANLAMGKTPPQSGKFGSLAFEGLEVDRSRPDREIYVRCATGNYGGNGDYWRFNEDAGEFAKVNFPGSGGVGGTCIVSGPDGIIYAPAYPEHILRYTRDGQPAPWPPGNVGYPPGKKGPPNGIYGPVSMGYITHTLGVRLTDGHFFFFDPGHPGDRPHKMLREYTPEGRLVSEDPIIWKVSDNCIGPKFDQQGNIYVAEQIKPLDQPCPPELAALVGKVEPGKTSLEKEPQKEVICSMYGSIVKFSPRGGMFHFSSNSSGGGNPFKGEPRLDPSLRTEDYASFYGTRMNPTKVTGAAWVRMGISHECLHYCNCENTRFDVDEFGRVWYPDLGRFRVCVLDTAGNDITHFGGYGNAESCGPDSPVIDPKTRQLRPRRDDDPKDLVSPLANPEIAFAWLIGVGVTDKYAYMGDSMNRRLLRAKLTYAADETCDVK